MRRPRPQRDRWRPLLMPLSHLYAAMMTWRNRRYDEPGAALSAGVPVISVGNLTVGGTGKTPLVMEIVRKLVAAGRRPAILTRGYHARRGETADEVQEYAAELPDVPVVVDADRVAGAATAQAVHAADCCVLDDGFQHRRLARDLDVVLIDALRPWGGDAVLPAGRLREPVAGLARAGVVVITRCNQARPDTIAAIVDRVRELAPHAARVRAEIDVRGVYDDSDQLKDPSWLRTQRLQPVCGVGNPFSFRLVCDTLADVVRTPLSFADHHRYTRADARIIVRASRQRGVDQVVTTRKDWGKLRAVWPTAGPPLLRLDIATRVLDPNGTLDTALANALKEHQ